MGFTLGSHEALKRGEKPPYWPLLRHQNTRFRPIQLFTKQFLEGAFPETQWFYVLSKERMS